MTFKHRQTTQRRQGSNIWDSLCSANVCMPRCPSITFGQLHPRMWHCAILTHKSIWITWQVTASHQRRFLRCLPWPETQKKSRRGATKAHPSRQIGVSYRCGPLLDRRYRRTYFTHAPRRSAFPVRNDQLSTRAAPERKIATCCTSKCVDGKAHGARTQRLGRLGWCLRSGNSCNCRHESAGDFIKRWARQNQRSQTKHGSIHARWTRIAHCHGRWGHRVFQRCFLAFVRKCRSREFVWAQWSSSWP